MSLKKLFLINMIVNYNVTKEVSSLDLNYIADELIWSKFGSFSFTRI